MKVFTAWLVCLGLLVLGAPAAQAKPLEEGLEEAAGYFAKEVPALNGESAVYLEVKNEATKRRDRQAGKIEALFMLALSRQNPRFTIHQLDQSLSGLSGSRAVLIQGSYEPKGAEMILRFQAIRSLGDGEVLGQTQQVVSSQKALADSLVAVLDLDAQGFSRQQRQVFSDIFRTELRRREFRIVSSAEVDKMDPDAIQQATGCTRDECATVIGEQLGVDLVVSLGYAKIGPDLSILTAKLINIENGSIVASETEETNGTTRGLPQALRQLAKKLADQVARPTAPAPAAVAVVEPTPQKPQAPQKTGEGFFSDLQWVPSALVGGPGLSLIFLDQSQLDLTYSGAGFFVMALQKDGWFADFGVSSGGFSEYTVIGADGSSQLVTENLTGTASAGHLTAGYQYHFNRLGQGWYSPIQVYFGLGSAWGDYTWQIGQGAENKASYSGFALQLGTTYQAFDRWLFGFMFYSGSGTLTSENQAFVDSLESASQSEGVLSVGYRF